MQFRAERRLIQAVFAETSACTNTRMSKHNYFTRICGLSTEADPLRSLYLRHAGGGGNSNRSTISLNAIFDAM